MDDTLKEPFVYDIDFERCNYLDICALAVDGCTLNKQLFEEKLKIVQRVKPYNAEVLEEYYKRKVEAFDRVREAIVLFIEESERETEKVPLRLIYPT